MAEMMASNTKMHRFSNTKDLIKLDIRRMLCEGLRSNRTTLSLNYMGLDPKEGNLSLTAITEALARYVGEKRSALLSQSLTQKAQSEPFPRVITFPYSRHSSYAELCHLVEAFDPRDVYPCTVDEANWDEEVSMENLFGGVCSAVKFRHDDEMRGMFNWCYRTVQTQWANTDTGHYFQNFTLNVKCIATPSTPRQQQRATYHRRYHKQAVLCNESPSNLQRVQFCPQPKPTR